LTLQVTCPDLLVRGDKLLLQQIIGNLVSNAIQYTENGHVDVHFSSEQDCLTINVSDTGYGIAESEQQHIFQQFYRSEYTRTRHDGLGLGLSIVQRLCHLIGADISLQSEQGRGTSFTVTTPFSVSVSEADIYNAPSTPKTHHWHRSLQGKYIAVIEDNPMIVEAYRQTLANKGASVLLLSDDVNELDEQLITIDHIDCILSDYRLSQTTGDLLIQKLRDTYNREIPAIIVTADTSPSHIHFFAQLNVQVLHKPISFQDVAMAIEAIMVSKSPETT
jgi:CheY-like chemotaxis protein/anti-sigma regulatory factor (Ser/Thr protein kinase)